MFNITPIIQCVIIVLVILGSAYGLPFLKSKMSVEKFNELYGYIVIAVKAAEQIFAGSGRGAEKKNYVLQWLNDRGITYDVDKVDAMIESAVYELNQEALYTEAVASTGLILNENYDFGETEGSTEDAMEESAEVPAEEPEYDSFSIVFPEDAPAEEADPPAGEEDPAQ